MHVLIAVGGFPYSKKLLRFGSQILQNAGEPATLLTVARRESDRQLAEETLFQAREYLSDSSLEIRTLIRIGQPAEQILREAEQGSYDLVIIGDKESHDLVSRFLLGSTAERVVEHAPCPVIVAKGRTSPIRRILLCDSGAGSPSLTVEPVPPLLDRFIAQHADLVEDAHEITVLHVMSQMSAGPGVQARQLRLGAHELIETSSPEGRLFKQDLEALSIKDARIKPKIRHGFVVDEIELEAREGEYDLLVIGAHRGRNFQRILLEDIAHKIITRIDRPILVVR
ncbi:MAG: universal stress protein [Anaerolineales bacterium]|nr:universal stress protein [Anaerolineales bacterium]